MIIVVVVVVTIQDLYDVCMLECRTTHLTPAASIVRTRRCEVCSQCVDRMSNGSRMSSGTDGVSRPSKCLARIGSRMMRSSMLRDKWSFCLLGIIETAGWGGGGEGATSPSWGPNSLGPDESDILPRDTNKMAETEICKPSHKLFKRKQQKQDKEDGYMYIFYRFLRSKGKFCEFEEKIVSCGNRKTCQSNMWKHICVALSGLRPSATLLLRRDEERVVKFSSSAVAHIYIVPLMQLAMLFWGQGNVTPLSQRRHHQHSNFCQEKHAQPNLT